MVENPQSAMAVLGDFVFLAGAPNEALARFYPLEEGKEKRDFAILVPQNEKWCRMIESCFGERAKKVTRYAIKKEGDIFDRSRLKAAAESFDGTEAEVEDMPRYRIKEIDEAIFAQCLEKQWSRDLVSNYADYTEYQKLGVGMAVLKDGEAVAGASSYSSYRDGIEIEIDTREDCRRQGLAYACGAALILKCLERGLYPSWDAQNKASVALAEKLGYHFSHEYTAYEVYERED